MRTLCILTCIIVLASSCSREIASNVYDSQNVGEAVSTYPAEIVQKHHVTVKNGEGLQDNTTGIIGGGLVGALLGSTIGHGSGSVVAEVAGGLAGATGGAAMEEGLKEQKAMEYIVKLDDGSLKTVVQAIEPELEVGDHVYVMISHSGRSRLIPR